MVGEVRSTVNAAVRAVALGRQVRLERLHHLDNDQLEGEFPDRAVT